LIAVRYFDTIFLGTGFSDTSETAMRERELMLGLPQRERIQARINHYLVRNRTALGITQSDMAKKLGYSVSAYRSFERSAETENRLVNALETISIFASLEEMSITEFVNFLEKGRSSEENAKPESAHLRRWEIDLLSALKRIDSSIRLKGGIPKLVEISGETHSAVI